MRNPNFPDKFWPFWTAATLRPIYTEKLITLTDVCNSYICKYQLKLPLDVLINNLPEQQLLYTKQSKLKVVKLIELVFNLLKYPFTVDAVQNANNSSGNFGFLTQMVHRIIQPAC